MTTTRVDFYDLSNLREPRLVGELALPKACQTGSLLHTEIADDGKRVSLACGTGSGLVILDLEDFDAPPVVLAGGPLRQSVIGDGIAVVKGDYTGEDEDKSWLVDLTDPQAPTRRVLTSLKADFLDGGAFTKRDGRTYFVARAGQWYDVTGGDAFTKVERTSSAAAEALDDGEALYRQSFNPHELRRFARNGEERVFGKGVVSFALHDGLLYWTEDKVLHAADPHRGELVSTAQHDHPLYNLTDAGPVLISGEWLNPSWVAYDPDAQRFSKLELPPELSTCQIATAREGHLLCSTGERLYVLGVIED